MFEGLKDTKTSSLILGIILPLLLLGIIACNLCYFEVLSIKHYEHAYDQADHIAPSVRKIFVAYHDVWHVWGLVVMKLGLAGIFFSWHYLANFDEWELRVYTAIYISVVMMIIGVMLFIAGQYLNPYDYRVIGEVY